MHISCKIESILVKKCMVGHATEVKHSVFLDEAKAKHFAYLGDSILGRDVNLGAGTKCANLRFLPGRVMIRTGQGRLDSGLLKFGAILGDRVQKNIFSRSWMLAHGIASLVAVGMFVYDEEKILARNVDAEDPESLVAALCDIEQASRATTLELRRMLQVLRFDQEAPLSPSPGDPKS